MYLLRDLPIRLIDYSASDPAYRKTETHVVSELDGHFLIPFQGPMYTRNLVIRADGNPLTLDKDYFYEDDFTQLEVMTGKRVICSLRLSSSVLNSYKNIKLVYQQAVDLPVSRQFLLDSLDEIAHGTKPIDWLTHVFGKPDTYWPARHLHDITSKDEMVGFSDLVVLFKQLTGQTKKQGRALYDRLKSIETRLFTKLDTIYQARWNALFSHILNTNNPHKVTKAQLDLGNHPDYATASTEQDRNAGLLTEDKCADNVISTPYGLRQAIAQKEVDTDPYLKQQSIPFSYYGSGIYIPPPISGSFEGLGTNRGGNAFCVESNGYTVLLTRGYDSKVRALYYYYNKNIYDTSEDFIFSGYRYQSSVMEAEGHEPNHILSGSNHRIMVIGDKEKNQYYITLTNGTLDANAHQLMKIDMGAFYDDTLKANLFTPDQSNVLMIGDWAYIITHRDVWAPNIPQEERISGANNRTRCFYRIPLDDLRGNGGKTVTFKRQLITFTNTESVTKTNQTYVDITPNVTDVDSEGKRYLKRCVYTYTTPPTTVALGSPWRCQWFSQEDPTNKNRAAIRMFHNTRWTYRKEVVSAADWWFCIPMFFDTNTNTLTLDERYFTPERDILTNKTIVPEGRNINEWFHGNISSFCAAHAEVAASFVPKLGYVRAGTQTNYLPYSVLTAYMGYNPTASGYQAGASDWDIFTQNLTGLGGNGYRAKNIPLDSPFGFASKPSHQRDLWHYNGKDQALPLEVFNSFDRNSTKTLWFRETKDRYDYHTDSIFTFKYVDKTVIGRTPSTTFGQAQIGERSINFSARTGYANFNTKDKYSCQYGLINIRSRDVKTDISVTSGLWYDNINATVTNGDIYVGLLAKHTYDPVAKSLKIEKIPSESIFVKRSVWVGLLNTMLGPAVDTITDGNGGNKNGEYVFTVFFGAKPGNSDDVFPSLAMLVYHDYSAPTKNIGVFASFNWAVTATQTDSNGVAGVREIRITDIRFPDEKSNASAQRVLTTNWSYNASGIWNDYDRGYNSEMVSLNLHMEWTSNKTYAFWLTSGMNHPVPLNAESPCLLARVENHTAVANTFNSKAVYNYGAQVSTWLYVTDLGLCHPIDSSVAGGAALYVQGGNIPDDQYALLQAVFIEGNWTLFVNSDITATFNGVPRLLKKTNYDLSDLGTNYKNTLFYLYAVSGQSQGYYDLTNQLRTASPYQLLVAKIKTNAFGIESIDVEQRFAINGFTISTLHKGGIVPATSGSFATAGTFTAVLPEDLV